MPIVHDKLYPELESSGFYSRILRILIDSRAAAERILWLATNIRILKEYLKCEEVPPIEIEFFIAPGKIPDYLAEFDLRTLPASTILLDPKEEIHIQAERNDIDLVATEDNHMFSIPRIAAPKYWVADFETVLRSIEYFCRGHNIPWAFRQPVWKAPWHGFHSLLDEDGSKAKEEYNSALAYFPEAKIVRDLLTNLLLNRMSHVIFTRDKLQFLIIERRFANRRNWSHQRFNFEVSYYLNHYYLLLWGGIDQLSNLINLILGLQVSDKIKVSIGNQRFLNKIFAKCPDLGKQLVTLEVRRWLEQLKTNRDLAAHANVIHLTPILELPAVMPTDEELETEAKATRSWEGLRDLLTPEQFDGYHRSLKEKILLSKCKTITTDSATIEENGVPYHTFPLVDIDWNFNNYLTMIFETLAHLRQFCINNGQGKEWSEK
jgi:hypothetical protein